MKKKSTFILLLLVTGLNLLAQVGINSDNLLPDPSAGLDVNFSDKGFLLPRMTYDQRVAIVNPAEGLMVFCTDCGSNGALSIFSNGAWRSFIPCVSTPTTQGVHTLSPGQINWSWNTVAGALGYKWNTTANYGSAIDMGTATIKAETGIACGTTVTRYVWAYDECGISVPATLTQAVSALVPASPVAGTQTATQTDIVWNWNSVPDAVGYKWSATNDFATATEMGTATTKTETGLECGTPYTRYVWAYNGCGYSLETTLTQSTFDCSGPFTIGQHYGGGVIFYLDGSGNHGLIAAESDQGSVPWGCYGTVIGCTPTEIGTGQANTTAIVNGCSEEGIAARICNDLVLDGYSDWFLPSKDELAQMFIQKDVIGGFSIFWYCSSSEANAIYEWSQGFSTGMQANGDKTNFFHVRAIRAF